MQEKQHDTAAAPSDTPHCTVAPSVQQQRLSSQTKFYCAKNTAGFTQLPCKIPALASSLPLLFGPKSCPAFEPAFCRRWSPSVEPVNFPAQLPFSCLWFGIAIVHAYSAGTLENLAKSCYKNCFFFFFLTFSFRKMVAHSWVLIYTACYNREVE